jgi:Rad3-related DNA helicase
LSAPKRPTEAELRESLREVYFQSDPRSLFRGGVALLRAHNALQEAVNELVELREEEADVAGQLEELKAAHAKELKGLRDALRWWNEHTEALEKNWNALVEVARRERDKARAEVERLKGEVQVAWADCHDGSCRACAKCFDAVEAQRDELVKALRKEQERPDWETIARRLAWDLFGGPAAAEDRLKDLMGRHPSAPIAALAKVSR